MSNQRKKAEDWLFHISNDESWIDASSEGSQGESDCIVGPGQDGGEGGHGLRPRLS